MARNVREIKNAMLKVVMFCDDEELLAEHLDFLKTSRLTPHSYFNSCTD
jgi:transcriptional regulator of aromatic amino acid metabolism